MAYTFTRTAVRYSTDSESSTISLLLNRIGATNIVDKANFFSEIAGIARLELDVKKKLGESSDSIDTHYRDAEDLIRNNLHIEANGDRVTGYLADLMERISTDLSETVPQNWLNETYQYLAEEKKLPLTKEQCFGLGLATFFLAGPSEYRQNWYDRKGEEPLTLIANRDLGQEKLDSIKQAWDEIHQPAAPEGQAVPQSLK
jgi:hypothetical protein